MDRLIYMDNAATTALKPEVFEAMKPYFLENYSNPNSVYTFAQHGRSAVEEARGQIAELIGAQSADEIYFTSGGSESDNWALTGCAEASGDRKKHIITTAVEHHAVLHTCEYLERRGFEVTYLGVDEYGLVRPDELEAAIRPDTFLVSVMFANNEIGTVEPVREIGAITKKHGVLFHVDAVQAVGHIPVNVQELGIDLLSASAHKFHGPKGTGFLYIRNGVKPGVFMHGGAQERGRRGGTINVPGVVGMARAAQLASADMEENAKKTAALRDRLIKGVLDRIPYSRLNGHPDKRLPNNANFCFRFVEGESLLIMLDQKGICGSSGSACTSGSLDPSHVLLAIGLPHEIAHGSLRLTLSESNTEEDVDYTIDCISQIVERLRSMSPLYEDFVKKNQG